MPAVATKTLDDKTMFAALVPQVDLAPSQWAEQYRVVTEGPYVGSGHARAWSNRVFPPGVDIMDSVAAGRWRRTVVMAAPQMSGKTALMTNVGLWALHWRRQNVFYVHATRDRAKSQFDRKIGPAFPANPELAELIPASRDHIGTSGAHYYSNGCVWYVGGSESEGELSGPTVAVLLADDVHAMPARLGTHGHPVEFAERRLGSFPPGERCCMCCGQASDVANWLWQQLVASTFYALYLPCLKCGRYQLMDWARMEFDATSPETALQGCRLRCANDACDHLIEHSELPAMLQEYRWVSTPVGANVVHEPGPRSGLAEIDAEKCYPESARPARDCGFWWSALYYPLVPWTQHAADHVASAAQSAKDTFHQQTLVIPRTEVEDEGNGLRPEDIEAHQEPGHKHGTIPAAVGVQSGDGVVIVVADVMGGWIWELVIAVRKLDGETWIVGVRRLGTRTHEAERADDPAARRRIWGAAVDDHLNKVWDAEARGWPVVRPDGTVIGTAHATLGVLDAKYLGEVVRAFCVLRNSGQPRGKWRAVMGSPASANNPQVPLWPVHDIPTRGKKGSGVGRLFWVCNVNRAGFDLLDQFAIPPGRPGYLHIPADLPPWLAEQLRTQLTAEDPDRAKGTFKKRHVNNHLWDCLRMAHCAAHHLGCARPGSVAPPAPPQRTQRLSERWKGNRRERRGRRDDRV